MQIIEEPVTDLTIRIPSLLVAGRPSILIARFTDDGLLRLIAQSGGPALGKNLQMLRQTTGQKLELDLSDEGDELVITGFISQANSHEELLESARQYARDLSQFLNCKVEITRKKIVVGILST